MLKQKPDWKETLSELDGRVAKILEDHGIKTDDNKIGYLDVRDAVFDLFRAHVIPAVFTVHKDTLLGESMLMTYDTEMTILERDLADSIYKRLDHSDSAIPIEKNRSFRSYRIAEKVTTCIKELLQEIGLPSRVESPDRGRA